ncbi:YitT family protein [Ectobacillus sp. JY-23]|uniref:YitT family protein n=1 Tax=Ectobacillus sp. JY-23 TaxID=2933872 RepID=UPI001FF460C1|nr:YitT family protein [Ectobacillus sp. JY-23]UOY92603.1 YitT family protein [Ectobacillus sp. JY-23]
MKWIRWKEASMIVFGSFVLAAAFYHIHVQNNLAEGGFIGIALLVKQYFNISPAVTTLLLDIPLILVGSKLLGKRLAINTIIGATSFSIFYALMERYSPFSLNLSQHLFVASIIGGVLVGAGLGLILRHGGATGGDDILSLLISKISRLSVGKVYFVFDAVVLLASLMYLSWNEVAYTILSVAVCAYMTDLVLYYRKQEPVYI